MGSMNFRSLVATPVTLLTACGGGGPTGEVGWWAYVVAILVAIWIISLFLRK